MKNDTVLWLFPKNRVRLFYILLALNFICILALQTTGNYLKTDIAPLGILSYEFAGDLPKVQEILASWDASIKVVAGINLGIDYLFLMLYSQAIALACVLAGSYGKINSMLTSIAANLQFLAALLDAVENYALIQLLMGSQLEYWPPIAYWCAIPKFSIVTLGLVFVFYAGIKGVINRL